MNEKQQAELEIIESVHWCFKRAEKLSGADVDALYGEFHEWIEYVEDETIDYVDVTKIRMPSK